MSLTRRRKCRHCGQLYDPDPRNRYHQKYCGRPACRQASKATSQQRWRASPKGKDYFCGSANVLRVRAWRQAHPGYWRKHRRKSGTLQDHIALTTHRLIRLGQEIQGPDSRRPANGHPQARSVFGSVAAGTAAVQLDRPSSGSG